MYVISIESASEMGKLNSSSISISGGIGVVGVLCVVAARCEAVGVAACAFSISDSFIIVLGRRNVAISYAMFMPRITSYRVRQDKIGTIQGEFIC